MRKLIGLLASLFCVNGIAGETTNSAVGYWKTVDDVSGRVQSIVKIYETPDHHLSGKILKTYPKPGDVPLKICSACSGDRYNQPVIGLVFMTDLKPTNSNRWVGGEIVDPKTGKIYKCSIQPTDDNQKLTVRGYIGIPLFGRTQTWLRTTVN